MATIATLLPFLGTLQKFLGITFKEGLPEQFIQTVIDDPKLRHDFIEWADRRMNANPCALSVEEQINRLRLANKEEGWGLDEEVFDRLAKTAPEWPKGFDAFRGIRVRLGMGRDGVIKTFEAHAARINRVFEDFWRWDLLLSGEHPYNGKNVERLRLLNGNDTHEPGVEWFVTNLSEQRRRNSITALRGPKSLADEGLALAWMFPDRVKAIDYDKLAAWYLAGYELNVPEHDGESWYRVPVVHFYRGAREVSLHASGRGVDSPGCSVPSSGSGA